MVPLLIVAVLSIAGGIFFLKQVVPPAPTTATDPPVESAVEGYRDLLDDSLEAGTERTRNLDPSDSNRDR